ncbi:uncharacterized protein B0T23DRAFT_83891 [Neurospora hispaniola]|uniref:Uncharacterized protein n=1 Tax=Neurospora hispaniola TaxID=588809 RepID=A0AAJ0ID01_9PEZI|nr:hypothetical protein B0T23DRAFT_83891 [Neurospora hispaniola]
MCLLWAFVSRETPTSLLVPLHGAKGRYSCLAWLTVSRSLSICIVYVLHLPAPIENNRKNFTPSLKTYELFDSTSNMPTLKMYWMSAKVNAAITCACIMILKPLIQQSFGRIFSTLSHYIHDYSLLLMTPIPRHPQQKLPQ